MQALRRWLQRVTSIGFLNPKASCGREISQNFSPGASNCSQKLNILRYTIKFHYFGCVECKGLGLVFDVSEQSLKPNSGIAVCGWVTFWGGIHTFCSCLSQDPKLFKFHCWLFALDVKQWKFEPQKLGSDIICLRKFLPNSWHRHLWSLRW